jgi:hypothetical protein
MRLRVKSTRLFSTRRLVAPVALALVAGVSLLSAAPASAFYTRHLVNTFSIPQSALPNDVAINQSTGEIYAATGSAVDAFEASGTPDPVHPKLTEANGTTPYPFAYSWGVTVDNSAGSDKGDVYVADFSAQSVIQFDPSGARTPTPAITALNVPANGTAQSGGLPAVRNNGRFNPIGVAVASNGDIYVGDDSNLVVDVFEPSGAFVSQLAAGDISVPFGVAVAPSGDLYAASNNGTFEFEPSGACANSCHPVDPSASTSLAIDGEGNVYIDESSKISEFNASGERIGGFGSFNYSRGIATGGDKVYLANFYSAQVEVYGPPIILPDATILPTTEITRTSVKLNGEVSAAEGPEASCKFEYSTDESFAKSAPCEPAGPFTGSSTESVSSELSGLSPATTYHYRLSATSENGTNYSEAKTVETHPAVEEVKVEPATNKLPTSATLNGSFIGNGEDTKYYFEWRTNEGYFGHKTPVADAGSPPGPGPTAVSEGLSGLRPATAYNYRLVASNKVGATVSSNEESFNTPPAPPLVNESASDVHSESAKLSANINPGGAATTYHFEYGTASCASNPCVSTPSGELPAGLKYVGVSAPLSGLSPATTYHYRVVATNSSETTDGPDQTFTTFPFLSSFSDSCTNAHVRQQTGAALLPDCRAYELVSSANTGGYDVESSLSAGQEPYGGYPEASGATGTSRALYGVHDGGIPGLAGDPTNKGVDPYVATRGENGWSTEYVGVPANDPFASAGEPFSSVPTGADASLDAFAFGAPGGCSPCFAGGYTGIPVRVPGSKEVIQGMVAAKGFPTPPPSAKPDGHIAKDLSANGEHLIFGSTTPFAEGGNENTGDVSIYDRNLKTEETYLLSNSPAGEGHPLACLPTPGECHSPGDTNGISELDISADGSHVLLGQKVSTDAGNVYWHLYMNIGDSEKTIALTPGASGLTGGVLFDGMTADGEKVFFSSTEHLTGEDEQHSGADIFMWSQKGEEEDPPHPLTLISSGTEGNAASCDPAANSAHVHWNTTGSGENCGDVAIGGGGGVASGNGTIYFLSPSLLAGTEEPADGVKSAPNLYVARPGSAPEFVATLESFLNGPNPPLTRHSLVRGFGAPLTPTYIAVDNSCAEHEPPLTPTSSPETCEEFDPSNGDVYVVTGGNKILKFDSSGNPITSWGNGGELTGAPEGIGPAFGPIGAGIAVGPGGVLYVDASGGLFEFEQDGTFISRGGGLGYQGYPGGIEVNSKGYIYVPEYSFNVRVFSPTLVELGVITRHAGNYNAPSRGYALDPAKDSLLQINSTGELEEYVLEGPATVTGGCTSECTPTRIVASGFSTAHNLSVDENGDIYIDLENSVVELNPEGTQIGEEIGSGHLENSEHVAVSSSGNVYVDDPTHSDVAEFGPSELAPNPRTDNPAVLDGVNAAGERNTADFQVTPDGGFAAFPSTLPLTGFNSAGHREIYRYAASTGKLNCASCDPTGVEPTSDSTLASNGLSLTNDGRIFFTTAEPLALRDTDNRQDVYEWEEPGAGNCEPSSPNYSRGANECLSLISSGTSPFDSILLGAGSDGTDAFFFTRDSLAPQDENGPSAKLYDAREHGGFAFKPEPPSCKSSDECHGPGSPPPPPPDVHVNTGASGNESPPAKTNCKPGFVKKHGKCVKKPKPHKRHKAKRHRGGKKK